MLNICEMNSDLEQNFTWLCKVSLNQPYYCWPFAFFIDLSLSKCQVQARMQKSKQLQQIKQPQGKCWPQIQVPGEIPRLAQGRKQVKPLPRSFEQLKELGLDNPIFLPLSGLMHERHTYTSQDIMLSTFPSTCNRGLSLETGPLGWWFHPE